MFEVAREPETIFWESQSCAFCNSENSGSRKKPPDLGSNTQTPTGNEMVVAQVPGGKNRSRGGKKKGKGSGGCEVTQGTEGGESDHEIHIWTERERRKKMRNMFSNLHALLPQLPPKADKSTIVDEAVSYIKTLQQNLQKLQRKKLERLHGVKPINYDSSIVAPQKLAIESREAFIADQVSSNNLANTNSISSMSILPFVSRSFQTWTSQNVILNVCGEQAQINICSPRKPGIFTAICYVMEKYKIDVVSAHVSSDNNSTMFMIQAHARIARDQLPEAFPVEEIYKQAAREIMMWVYS